MARWIAVLLLLLIVDGAQAESPRVTVLDFKPENFANGNDDWTVGLADFVELALQKEGVATLERRQIRLVLGERELQAGGLVRAADFKKRGLPAVDYFVSGTVRRLAGNEFELTVALNRADNATMESSFTQRGVYPADWLSAIDSIAGQIATRLRVAKRSSPETGSEFESLTWLPEAALPFFKGLEYYARGDQPQAAGWFRTASGKDPRFDQARFWEARALRQFGFPELAEFAIAATGKRGAAMQTNAARLPVVAVIAPDGIPAAGRAALVSALAQSGRYEMFEPQAIGATAREIDLQLTGQMAAPLNERSVWLVVDSMVFLEMSGGRLRARQSDLLSGRVIREVSIAAADDNDQQFIRLASEFAAAAAVESATAQPAGEDTDVGEPTSDDRKEVAFGKVLRLARAHPDQARPWIGLADFYGEWKPRMLLLDRAIAAIESNPNQKDAPFCLTSALWRKRVMVRRAWFYPDSTGYQENPLTNDFALLLKLFPQSTEAQTLDEWTRKSGKYTYSYPKGRDSRFLMESAYPGGGSFDTGSVGDGKPPAAASEEQWLARLEQNHRLGNYAKTWMQADWNVPPLSAEARQKANGVNAELLQIARRDDDNFKAFTAAVEGGDRGRALELGESLLNCLFRMQRLVVIEKCGDLLNATRGCEAQVRFLIAQLERYKDDFNFDPVTGAPRTETIDFRFEPRADRPNSWANIGPDLSCSVVLGRLVENGPVCGDLELTAKVYEALRDNSALPLGNRLTAMFDLARTRYDQGRAFEAMELLQTLLLQTDGVDVPQARGPGQIGVGLESDAFALLKKIRLFADPQMDFAECCGQLPRAPLSKPDNLEAMNRWFDELWGQGRGGVGGDNRLIKDQLIERRAEALPALLYNLQRRVRAQQMVMFAGMLGTNALETLPFVVHYVCWSDAHPGSVYCNALAALGGFGTAASGARPVLILASEGEDYLFNVKAALARIGPAPPRVMPYLGRLLYHQSSAVAEKSAQAMVETAKLTGPKFAGTSGGDLILAVRQWWEEQGQRGSWTQE